MGAALIPNKQIYRKNDKTKDEYYIYFSEATIRKASELFLMNANQNNSTLEHSTKLKGMSVVESWIVEGENDKSKNYGFNFPKGTWVISMKVNNDEIWDKVKLGEVKGFSIEGYFADKLEMSLKNEDMEEKVMIEKIKSLIEKSELKSNKLELSLADDFNSQVNIFDATHGKFINAYYAMQKAGNIVSQEGKNYIAQLDKTTKLYDEISKKAKELGLEFSNTKSINVFKDLSKDLNKQSAQKIIDRSIV